MQKKEVNKIHILQHYMQQMRKTLHPTTCLQSVVPLRLKYSHAWLAKLKLCPANSNTPLINTIYLQLSSRIYIYCVKTSKHKYTIKENNNRGDEANENNKIIKDAR